MDIQTLNTSFASFVSANMWLIPVMIWAIVWKLIALWKAARNGHLTAFIVLAFVNTLGIAEIGYLIWVRMKEKKGE